MDDGVVPAPDFDPQVYWNRRHGEHPGLEGVGDVRLGAGYNSWLYGLRRRALHRLVRNFALVPADLRVLDVGSGTGFYLRIWKALGVSDLVGSDISSVAVGRLTEELPGCRIVRLDIGEPLLEGAVSEAPGTFDLVSAFDVLFHIVDDTRYKTALGSVAELLEPGGWFVFSENFVHGPSVRYSHQVSRSLEEIGAALDAAGFDIVVRRPMMAFMNFPIDSESRLLRWLWNTITLPGRFHNSLGWVIGALLYPLDILLSRVLREGPSTEICFCRRRIEARV
jgi:SAM-dependent methyltransferase